MGLSIFIILQVWYEFNLLQEKILTDEIEDLNQKVFLETHI